jgi:hypothetical protein
MKKIGILFGQETTFPPAFVERVPRLSRSHRDRILSLGCQGRALTDKFIIFTLWEEEEEAT